MLVQETYQVVIQENQPSTRTDNEHDEDPQVKTVVKSGKPKSRAEKRDCSIKGPDVENDIVMCYRDNPFLWDMTYVDFENTE